jgi:molybdopterin-containing oxidoreductase family membrane subunit
MSHHISPIRQKWVEGTNYYSEITESVCKPIQDKPSIGWLGAFALSTAVLGIFVFAVAWTIYEGIGAWGLNKTVGWAFDITNFVFWVGIGHAGTLISAVLLLFRQAWRNSINRATEAMTIFAVICAGQFPIIHMGRPWLGLWFLPFPNTRWRKLKNLLMHDEQLAICNELPTIANRSSLITNY